MRNPFMRLGFLLALVATFAGAALITFAGQRTKFYAEAAQVTSPTEARFWVPSANHYASYISDTGQIGAGPAFAWDMAVQLSSLAAAMRQDVSRYRPLFDRAEACLEKYGSDHHGVFGYGDLPARATPDRFYDDNEWIALAQMDAYGATRDERYLGLAKRTFKFVMSGESSDLGGGLFWREKDKKSKNSCSNAPAIAVAARLYLATKDIGYLQVAERLHKWVECLKDPADNLMFDHMDLTRKIDKTKWSYNTALMIRGDLLLYRATNDSQYLQEAVAMGKSSVAHWVDSLTGAIHDEASFAHHLAEAFLDLGRANSSEDWKGIADRAIQYAYENTSRNGLYTLRWDRYQNRDNKVILLYQASVARELWEAAE